MAVLMLRNIIIKKDILKDAKYANLFTVETVNQLVLAGMPFRDAYKKVGLEVEKGNYKAPSELSHTHEGSMGNLYNEAIEKEFLEKMKEFV
jgi:argininosuccinate lyase